MSAQTTHVFAKKDFILIPVVQVDKRVRIWDSAIEMYAIKLPVYVQLVNLGMLLTHFFQELEQVVAGQIIS